ncbi:amino acid ABC transporter substrate-binding protein [Acidovorax sp. 106]|uniref:amino acid ABC transporter substrate-binding protein n=1 Tax=Acidovorax sp. 106 TaxID=2135637 RepID=UPI000F2163B2|nr:amino acid ABC transporter substrate-binding protein [Acidovorax sp. 106]RLJ39011.1 amino acid ABC transporter substrate-binding protein (PAAT family) [Acidovorax sp. 106]
MTVAMLGKKWGSTVGWAVLAFTFGTVGCDKVLAQSAALSQAAPKAAPQVASSSFPGKTLQRIQLSGVVVIGHRESSIPMSYVANGTPMGYSVDVCLQIAQTLGRHLKLRETKVAYRLVTSSSRFDAIEKGEVDLECGSTTNTAARRERVAFTIAHFIASSRILVQSDRPYSRIEDLDGKTVASTAGTTNIDSLAREAASKVVRVRIEAAKDHAEGFGWVVSGKVEGFAMDDVLLYGLRASHTQPQDLKVIGKPMNIEPYAVAFERNNPELKAVVDAELRRLIQTRELHRLYDKWFTQPIPPHGINLGMRMPHLLADSLKYPSDYVPQ